MTPSRRLQARHAYGRAVDTFDTVAWRAPTATRFDSRVANDVTSRREPAHGELADGVQAWLTITLGGLVAALAGALLGGALHI